MEKLQFIKSFPIPEIKGVEKKCTLTNKNFIKNIFKNLIIDNVVQHIKIFEENIIECADKLN